MENDPNDEAWSSWCSRVGYQHEILGSVGKDACNERNDEKKHETQRNASGW